MKKAKLAGRRIAVLAADGFEKVELTIPVKALRASGAIVDIVSIRPGRIRGVNLHEPASRVEVTKTLDEANPAEYDGLLIPGGFINPDLLRQSAKARAFARTFDEQQKPIASLCHGPWLLVSAGLLQGRTLTAWPGIRDDVVNAGAVWLDEKVVRDGNLVTSRGPQDLRPFVKAIKQLYSLQAPIPRDEVRPSHSAPQRDAPPALVAGAMKWIPKPSVRMALLVGALAAGAALGARRAR
jgi:protease I